MPRLFGTDGVRGVANADLSPELAFSLGEAACCTLAGQDAARIAIGRDTRRSGDLLEASLVSGICAAGGSALCLGVIPTPGVAHLVRELGARAGVVISASHNPAQYNGIKFFDERGFKLPDDTEDVISDMVLSRHTCDRPTLGGVGTIEHDEALVKRYVDHAVATVPGNLTGMKIAIDCGNGAAYETSPTVLAALGADVTPLNVSPDGLNINLNCGSTHMDELRRTVADDGFDVGLAHDGDADRLLAVDEQGNVVDGDFIMAICAAHLKSEDALPKDSIVTTVMTNLGFDLAMQRHGIKVLKTRVGDRYVLERMLETGATVGGEQSGHIIYLDHNTTGDGIITALQLLHVMKATGRPLSELAKVMERLPQVLINVDVRHKEKLDVSDAILERVGQVEAQLEGRGRILVRASGTEPMVRVMVEGDDEDAARRIAQDVADVVAKELA